VKVALHDLGGQGPSLLISHATGFHGRTYQPIADQLRDHFHSVALDYRGHGDTPLPDAPIDWERFGDDAEAVATHVAAEVGGPLVAFGHSMGGAALLMAAHRRPRLFAALVLFEPIVFPPSGIRPGGEGGSPLVAGARRRRSVFPSYQAAIDNFAAKPPLASFTRESLEAYVRFGFAEDADGQVHLKCLPETEASTFEASGSHHTWDALPDITTPVLVLSGRPEPLQPSIISEMVAELLPNGTYVDLDELDHFGPMTDPAGIAALIARFAEPG
jgi:pimeloyl-ACP methyl ester carboxylesterase